MKRIRVGQVLLIGAMGLTLVTHAQFLITVLGVDTAVLGDYMKNHLIREVLYACLLSIFTLIFTFGQMTAMRWKLLFVSGCAMVFPFWVAYFMGYTNRHMEQVWGFDLGPLMPWYVHGGQVIAFLAGAYLLRPKEVSAAAV